jgi:hypothetical protein
MGHDQDEVFEANLVNFHHLTHKKKGDVTYPKDFLWKKRHKVTIFQGSKKLKLSYLDLSSCMSPVYGSV